MNRDDVDMEEGDPGSVQVNGDDVDQNTALDNDMRKFTIWRGNK